MGRKTIIAALLAVALVGCEKSKEEKQREALQKVAEALVAEAISTVDPVFRLTQLIQAYPRPQSVAWQITNTRDAPVTIHRVLFNAEWEPAIAEIRDAGRGREYWSPSEQWVAVRRLTIGESCSVFQKGTRFANDRRNYGKEVVYIDLYTGRGNFRYRPSEGFEALPD